MEYKYELHCHTGPVSRCASVDPDRLVEIYDKKGYSGIVLTDHFSPMTFMLKGPVSLYAPKTAIDFYLSSYTRLKHYNDEGFTVLLGLELRHHFTVNDYLVYGVEEEWLRAQENPLMWNSKKMSQKVHEAGYLVYQAHPFRKFIKRCEPSRLDGIEVFNGHTDSARNALALEWAESLGKPMISGSDCHREDDAATGGIITARPVKNNADLLEVLRSGEYELIRNK